MTSAASLRARDAFCSPSAAMTLARASRAASASAAMARCSCTGSLTSLLSSTTTRNESETNKQTNSVTRRRGRPFVPPARSSVVRSVHLDVSVRFPSYWCHNWCTTLQIRYSQYTRTRLETKLQHQTGGKPFFPSSITAPIKAANWICRNHSPSRISCALRRSFVSGPSARPAEMALKPRTEIKETMPVDGTIRFEKRFCISRFKSTLLCDIQSKFAADTIFFVRKKIRRKPTKTTARSWSIAFPFHGPKQNKTKHKRIEGNQVKPRPHCSLAVGNGPGRTTAVFRDAQIIWVFQLSTPFSSNGILMIAYQMNTEFCRVIHLRLNAASLTVDFTSLLAVSSSVA